MTVRVMVLVAAWCAARRCHHLAHAIVRAPINNARSASVTKAARPTCSICARNSSLVAWWWRTPSTSARVAVNASSASVAAQTAISLAAPSAWAVSALNATHLCCWSIYSERRWSALSEIHSAARMGVDMPLCSRRAWITAARLPTCPPRSDYDGRRSPFLGYN